MCIIWQIPFQEKFDAAKTANEDAAKIEAKEKTALDNWNAANQDSSIVPTWELKNIITGQDLRKLAANQCMTDD